MGILARYAGLRSLWLGQLLSQLGNAVFLIMGLWEIQLHSPFLLAIAGLAMALPPLLAAAGGVVVDRFHPGRLMLYTDLVRGLAVALGLAALLLPGALIPAVIALLAVNSLGAALFAPAETTLLPRLVRAEDLTAANGVYNTTAQISGAVGAAIGGAAIAAIGVGWVFGFDMVSFWLSGLAIVIMLRTLGPWRAERAQEAAQEPQEGFAASLLEGFRAVRRLPLMLDLMPLILIVNFAFMAGFTMLPYWIHRTLSATALAYGMIDAAWAAGLVLGGLAAGSLRRWPIRDVASAMFLLQGLLFGAFALSHLAWLSGVLLLLAGIANGIGNAIIFTLLQRLVPEEVRGRAFGMLFTLLGLANPLGSLAAGALLHVLPLSWPWILGAVSMFPIVVGIWHLTPRDLGWQADPPQAAE